MARFRVLVLAPPSRFERLTCGLGIGGRAIHGRFSVCFFGFPMQYVVRGPPWASTAFFELGGQLAVNMLQKTVASL
jgi:hypothetical protein